MSNEQTFQTFLDKLASGMPTPGGGGAAAASGAMGAALISMVCNLTIGRKKFAAVEAQMKEILTQSEDLRVRLTQMIADDAEAYNEVMAAYHLPKNTPAETAARRVAIQEATKKASVVPLETVRACAQVINLGHPVSKMGNPNAISDAIVARFCAQAGLKGATLNVLVNLKMIKDEAFVTRHQAELEAILVSHGDLTNEVYELAKSRF